MLRLFELSGEPAYDWGLLVYYLTVTRLELGTNIGQFY